MAENEDILDDAYFNAEKKETYQNLAKVGKLMLNFVEKFNAGEVQFPRALYLVDLSR